MSSPLARFQLSPLRQTQKIDKNEELKTIEAKNISDVLAFNATGDFYIVAKIDNLQYQVYNVGF